MNTTTPRPPLPRWVWVVGGAIVAAAIVVGVVLWAQRPTDPDAGPTPGATGGTTATPGTDTETVTGCLAEGQGIDMLLTTQESAPQSEAGAVEFATAQMRWTKQWPWASFEEFETANVETWAGGQPIDRAQYDAMVAGPNASSGIVPDGTPFHLTSVVGRWYVDAYDGDTAQVTIGLAFVIGEAVSPLYRSVGTYNLEWTENGWVTKGTETKHTVEEAFDLGDPYTGGC
ncbi:MULTISPECIES: hypothetical protein [unclassified Microbacterium]|uniref:hypothetical protein n=1 Tax=unclassified Microbacterium TaxID=2609290 RepID=UPI000EA84D0A|nr:MULTISPECIES: hypothetical protein [unclassified Microbacterium]MBT2486934.1 hypothetical protein [Microbacterium sp. ISL-108]RKN64336.1 hypothetical protein D7252_19760 [Microbacterium sp. CGR2]